MITAFLLLALGLLLIFIEFYLPGGIMGISGGIMIILSIVVFARSRNALWEVIAFIFLAVFALGLLIRWTLWRIQHAKPERSIYGWGDQQGYQASAYNREAIGKSGIVSSDLKPGGHIVIAGKAYSAISLEGYLPKGTQVIVVSGEGETLYVRKNKEDKL